MNYIKEFYEHMKKNGAEGLLPQNLTDSILDRMLKGVEDFDNDDENTKVGIVMLAIYSMKHGGKINKNIKMTFSEGEDPIEVFDSYAAYLKLEGMRRNASLVIPDDSLPTLKNIFDKNRKIQISEVN